MRESLDYFFDLCYNMIDVKIGLAAEFFGQFGEGQRTRHDRFSQDKFCPRQSVGADNIRRTRAYGARFLRSRQKAAFDVAVFVSTPKKG